MCWFVFAGASTDNLPPGVLYRVKASYKYQAEDVDELNFEVGEVINVVTYEDPEEQVNKTKGFFYMYSRLGTVWERQGVSHENLPK